MAIRWKRNWYAVHRWLGLIVSLQLLAWSIGGFMFSVLDIENVRGELDQNTEDRPPLRLDRVWLSVNEAAAAAEAVGVKLGSVREMRLRERFDRTVFELLDGDGQPLGAVDAATGEFMARVSEEEVEAAARADFSHDSPVIAITLLEGEAPSEFRDGPMPVYQVILDHPKNPHLYISPITGDVLKRRNKVWRLFDFFWMLHIMDYRNRSDFNHWLLTVMSLLAVLTSASGLVLWWWRRPRWRKSTR